MKLCLAGPALAGVLHAGGVLQDATLPKQTKAGIQAVFAAKVAAGAGILDRGRLQPLQAVKLFSSIAAAMGSGGQANYASANAVLDNSAHAAQAQACLPGFARLSRRS